MDNDDLVYGALAAALAYVVYDNIKALNQPLPSAESVQEVDRGVGVLCKQDVEDAPADQLPRYQQEWARWRRRWGIWPNQMCNVGATFSNDSGHSMRQQMV